MPEKSHVTTAVVALAGVGLTLLGASGDAISRGSGGGGSGTTTTSYAGVALGVLPGDNQSFAVAVNDRGSVAGFSGDGNGGTRAFYWNSTGMYLLTSAGTTGHAHGIAGGTQGPEYVVGDEIKVVSNSIVQRPVIWTNPPSGVMAYLDSGGSAFGVNDHGTVVGSLGGAGVIWTPQADGTYSRTIIPRGAEFGDATAVDINNDGTVVVVAYRLNSNVSRAFVRRNDGVMIAVLPVGSDDRNNPHSISNVFSSAGQQFVYLAGTSGNGSVERGVRWTVNLTSRTVSALVLDQSWSTGVNSAGDVCGTVRQARVQKALLWRNGATFELQPLKGGRDTAAYDLARTLTSPIYVVGVSSVNNWPQAVRWEINR